MVINWSAVVLTRCVCVGRLLLSVVLLGLIVIVLSVGVVGLRTFSEHTIKWCVMILFFLTRLFQVAENEVGLIEQLLSMRCVI